MKNLTKLSSALLLFYVLFIYSCAAFRTFDMNTISIGMNKETVYKSLQQTPNNVIVVKQYPQGILEVVEYVRVYVNSGSTANEPVKPDKYWLYFFNNKLVQYGRPGNLLEEEDHIISMQTR